MSRIKLGGEAARFTAVDNLFIDAYLPAAPGDYVKTYVAGLSLCGGDGGENALEVLAAKLRTDVPHVLDAFIYWEQNGLVKIDKESLEVEYLPVKSVREQYRAFSREKYKTFNEHLAKMLPERNVLPHEFNEYYGFMEANDFEREALLGVISYCIRTKGGDISYRYILAVARNLAKQNCLTFKAVQEKLSEFDLFNPDLTAVLKTLKSKRAPDLEDKQMFLKWTKEMGFAVEAVIYAAKQVKKGGMERLDSLLNKFYEARAMSVAEMENYVKNRDAVFALAKEINRRLGVFYEQLDFIIEVYVNKWLNLGFTPDALTSIAAYCSLKRNVRTLDGMDKQVDDFYKRGLLTVQTIAEHLEKRVSLDAAIYAALERAGSPRPVTSRERDYFNTWKNVWGHSDALIDLAADLARGKENAAAYMNAVLSSWFENKITDVEAAKKFKPPAAAFAPGGGAAGGAGNAAVRQEYSAEELNALLEKLDGEI